MGASTRDEAKSTEAGLHLQPRVRPVTRVPPSRIKWWAYTLLNEHAYGFFLRNFPGLRDEVSPPREDPAAIKEELVELGIGVVPFAVAPGKFKDYLHLAQYQRYPYYYHGGKKGFFNKFFEHFMALEYLDLGPGKRFVDLASSFSPAADIYFRLTGVEAFRQDRIYPRGLRGSFIGGDAARLPVPDGFFHGISLHCSLEHFEGERDMALIREAERVLAPGGRMVVVPLYLSNLYHFRSDPVAFFFSRPCFEPGVPVYPVRGFKVSHSRVYSPRALRERIVASLGSLDLRVLYIENEKDVDPACYTKFVAVFQKG